MKTLHQIACSVLLVLASLSVTRGQLVPDGGSAVIDGTSTNINGSLIIGSNAPFTTLIITNAGVVTATNSLIGWNFGANTNLVVVTDTNSMWINPSSLAVGNSGSFNQLIVTNGGRVLNGGGQIGLNNGCIGNVVIVTGAGSVWSNNTGLLNIGNSGSSSRLLVNNGGMVTSTGGKLGGNTGSNNVVIIADPGSQLISGSEYSIGVDGSFNQMIVSNAAKVRIAGTYVGATSSATGAGSNNLLVVTDTGSIWTNIANLTIGNFGTGNQLIVTNGGVMRNTFGGGSYFIGFQTSASNNAALVTGTNSLISFASQLSVGVFGSFSRFEIKDGGQAVCTTANIGDSSARYNSVTVTGPGSKWTLSNVIRVGNSSSFNQLTVANGGNVSTPYLYIAGNSPGTNNTAWITDADSSVNVGFDMLVGFNGSYSQLTVSNSGIFTAGNSLVLGYNSLNNVATVSGGSIFVTNTFRNALTEVRGGTFNLNSGLLKSDSLTLTNGSQSQFNFNGGTLQTINSTNSRFFSVGDGTSSATLELLGGTNGFAGGLNINSNALLKGNGTIIGNVTNTGTLSPGTSVGQFTMKGSLIAGSGSTNMFELNKSATTNDNVIGLASVTYGGTLLLANLGGTLTNGDTFTLFTATNYAGAFDSITAPALAPGLKWSFDRLLIDGVVRVVANGPPVINSFNLINSTNLVFGITNGSPNDTVYLLTTTNLAEPATNWVRVLTNQFDSLGNLNITNAITTGETSRFYRLQVP